MVPVQHVAVSVGSGVILGLLMRSWSAGAACCFIGIFIDADHFFDFWNNRGFRVSVREFLDFCYHGTSRRFFDLLHGFEFIPAIWALTTLPGWHNLGWGLTVGYTIHLLCDQFCNTHLNRWTYFFCYRLFVGFDARRIVKGPA